MRHEHESKDDLRCFVRKVMKYLIKDLNRELELRSVILLWWFRRKFSQSRTTGFEDS